MMREYFIDRDFINAPTKERIEPQCGRQALGLIERAQLEHCTTLGAPIALALVGRHLGCAIRGCDS